MKFKELATSEKATQSNISCYHLTKTLNEYNIPYKTNKNNSLTFYLEENLFENKTYIIYGKTNKVIDITDFKNHINTGLTLLKFLKSKNIDKKYDKEDSEILSYTMTFGKYKYMTLKEILINDRNYLQWIYDNKTTFNEKLVNNIKYLLENSVDSELEEDSENTYGIKEEGVSIPPIVKFDNIEVNEIVIKDIYEKDEEIKYNKKQNSASLFFDEDDEYINHFKNKTEKKVIKNNNI